jgi:hypothetical protein
MARRLEPADLTIVRAERTSAGFPSQWDAWTDDGRRLYLRYRWGQGTVELGAGGDGPLLRVFTYGDHLDGVIDLPTFCREAGVRLALDPRKHDDPTW